MYSRYGRGTGRSSTRPVAVASANPNTSHSTRGNDRPSSRAWWNVQTMRCSFDDQFTISNRIAGACPRSMPRARSTRRASSNRCDRSDESTSVRSSRSTGISTVSTTSWAGRPPLSAENRVRRMACRDATSPKAAISAVSSKVPDDGADDLLEVHAGCLAEEAVEQHSLLRRRELVRVDDTDLARLRHSVTPRTGKGRLEEDARTLLAIARRTRQQRP